MNLYCPPSLGRLCCPQPVGLASPTISADKEGHLVWGRGLPSEERGGLLLRTGQVVVSRSDHDCRLPPSPTQGSPHIIPGHVAQRRAPTPPLFPAVWAPGTCLHHCPGGINPWCPTSGLMVSPRKGMGVDSLQLCGRLTSVPGTTSHVQPRGERRVLTAVASGRHWDPRGALPVFLG